MSLKLPKNTRNFAIVIAQQSKSPSKNQHVLGHFHGMTASIEAHFAEADTETNHPPIGGLFI
jgi:hypothetical protein